METLMHMWETAGYLAQSPIVWVPGSLAGFLWTVATVADKN